MSELHAQKLTNEQRQEILDDLAAWTALGVVLGNDNEQDPVLNTLLRKYGYLDDDGLTPAGRDAAADAMGSNDAR